MKKQNVRNTLIGTVIAIAILAAPALFVLGWLIPAPDPVPNADFGLVEEVYHPRAKIPITDLEGDTDVVTIDYYLPNYADDIYNEYVRGENYRWWKTHESDGLTLHLRATVHADGRLAQTSRHYEDGLPKFFANDIDNTNDTGCIEKLIDGEWVRVGRFEQEQSYYYTSSMNKVYFKALNPGVNNYNIKFPIHEPGEYRLTYNFRTLVRSQHKHLTTGAEQFSVSHTISIPEASGKKFDLVAPDLSFASNGRLRVAVLCRSNDGVIPYQNLENTRLEKFVDGEWVDASDALTPLVDLGDNGYYSAVGYETLHPFDSSEVTNLFCGIAEFKYTSSKPPYRLTLEFTDGMKKSDTRYALQINLDLS